MVVVQFMLFFGLEKESSEQDGVPVPVSLEEPSDRRVHAVSEL